LLRYETFIGPNAVEALKNYFKMRGLSGETIGPESPLFTSVSKKRKPLASESITFILLRLGSKIGIELSPHRLRKFFETRIRTGEEKVDPLLAKYWMGHKVKGGMDVDASYMIPSAEEQREEYMRAYSRLDLTPTIKREDLRMQRDNAAKILKAAGYDPELLLRKAKVKGLRDETDYLIREMGRLIGGRQKKETETNGGSYQKVVAEEELEAFLEEGWQVKAVLPSGRIVISAE